MPTLRRTPSVIATALCALFTAAGAASAHDFWIVPNAFDVAPGTVLEVRGQTSSLFPTSESAVAPDRVADARVIDARGDEPLRGFTAAGRSLLVRHRPSSAGQRVVAIALKPRAVRESPESFRRYMDLEGAPELRARYEREGRLPRLGGDSVTRRYAKYAKTLVEVGRGGPRAFARAAGHPLEFVPLSDPAALRPGDTLALRVVMLGRPLAGAHVHAGSVPMAAGAAALADTVVAQRAATADVSLTTDAHGTVRVVLDRAGLWNVRGIQIIPAEPGSGADWDVLWATVVFRVGGAGPAGGGASARPSDSAAVAGVVRRYGAALAAGDSATALDLLAPDAAILESGAVETREEYRAHHLPGDIAFARAVRSEDSPVRVTVVGDAAWAWSTSVTQGEYRGRAVNSAGAELMVLTRGSDGRWRIRAIHWSSRARRTQ